MCGVASADRVSKDRGTETAFDFYQKAKRPQAALKPIGIRTKACGTL